VIDWWFHLFIHSLAGSLQGGLLNSWTVVASSVEAVFGWNDAELQIMQLWIYVSYLLDMLPFTWLMDRKGGSVFTCVHWWLSSVCVSVQQVIHKVDVFQGNFLRGQKLLAFGTDVAIWVTKSGSRITVSMSHPRYRFQDLDLGEWRFACRSARMDEYWRLYTPWSIKMCHFYFFE